MTDQTTAQNTVIDGAIVEVKPDNALVVLNPAKYAEELFARSVKDLAAAKRLAAKTPYDINTETGMVEAKAMLSKFVKLRTGAHKAKTEAKRSIDQAGKLILSGYTTFETACKAEEAKHKAVIEAREAEIEAEKQRKIDEERARVEAIENRIANIRGATARMAQADSATIAVEIQYWTLLRLIPAEYEEQIEDALNAVNTTIADLEALRATVAEREAAAAKAKADALELERLRAAAAETERLAKVEREQRESDEKSRTEAAATLAREQAQMIADLKAKLAAINAPPAAVEPEQPASEDFLAASSAPQPAVEIVVDNSGTNGIVTPAPVDTTMYQGRPRFAKNPDPAAIELVRAVAIRFKVSEAAALGWIKRADFDSVVPDYATGQ